MKKLCMSTARQEEGGVLLTLVACYLIKVSTFTTTNISGFQLHKSRLTMHWEAADWINKACVSD